MLSTDFNEGCYALIELCAGVCCRDLYTNTSLILRYYGVVESGYVDTLIQQVSGHYFR